MPTLQEAFLVGCHVTSTGIYFNQAVLAVDLSNHPEEDLQQQSTFWIEHLKEIGPNFAQIIQVSNYIATQSEISEISSPTTPEEYPLWANNLHKGFMEHFGEEDIERYLYLYGFAMGEVMTNVSVLCATMDFKIRYNVDYDEQILSNLKEIPDLLTRWNQIAEVLAQMEPLRLFWRRCVEIQAELAEILRFDLKNYHLEEEPTIPTRDDNISPFSVASPKLRSLADKLGSIEKELSMLLPSEEEANDEQEATEN